MSCVHSCNRTLTLRVNGFECFYGFRSNDQWTFHSKPSKSRCLSNPAHAERQLLLPQAGHLACQRFLAPDWFPRASRPHALRVADFTQSDMLAFQKTDALWGRVRRVRWSTEAWTSVEKHGWTPRAASQRKSEVSFLHG